MSHKSQILGQFFGFDIDDVKVPSSMYGLINGLLPFNCTNNRRYPYRFVVNLYAKVGLHRYNMLEGTSFKHSALMKFNMVGGFMSSFYMTLLAHNPDPAASTLQKTFQVRVDEGTFGSLDITCSIARPKDEVTTKTPFIPHFHGGTAADGIFKGELPDWPSDDAFNDGKRFYMSGKPLIGFICIWNL
ncbi:hypothetical protein EUTSA_v10009578mg [Eutrema salsugineum]|uniref:Uncharacterized protein n=1 Tax=Eutrema salsugineum TaxID=72664 RepID=V4KWH9_EUTSA|nr:hypothetical protein EUTSA_v10009578mg [Eutrema salsugineum]